jgi:uncharacterized protein (TIGR03437 family)
MMLATRKKAYFIGNRPLCSKRRFPSLIIEYSNKERKNLKKSETTTLAALFFAALVIPAAHAARVDQNTASMLGLRPMQTPDNNLRLVPQYSGSPRSSVPQPQAVSSNGVIYSVTDLFDTQQIATCFAPDGSTFAAYATRSIKGVYSITVDGFATPLISDTQLPGGQTLSNNGVVSMGCSRDNAGLVNVFFLAVDPNHKLSNGSPFLSVWHADSNGNSAPLAPVGKTFNAKDPRNGQDTAYTIVQVSGLEVRNGKATAILVATPPQVAGALPPGPQGLFVDVGPDGQIAVIFSNLKDQNNNFWFSAISEFVRTDTSLYIAGQLADSPPVPTPPATKSNQVQISRIGQDGKPVSVKGYFDAAGSLMTSWNNGIHVTSLDSTGAVLQFSFLPDTSLPLGGGFNTGEVRLFAGSIIDGVALSSRDAQFPVGQKELYIISAATGSLLDVNNGSAHLVHTPQMAPGGNARAIIVAGGQIVYVQNQGNVNYTYNVYIPSLAQSFYTGLPGDIISIQGNGLVVDGVLPSVTLNIGGRNVQFGADSTGRITVNIPSFGQPGTYNGTINVNGVILPLTVVVQVPGQPAAIVTSIQNGATFQASSLVPEELVTIFLAKPVGTQSTAQTYPTYELGNVSATFEGTPMPLIFSGQGQINALLPRIAAGATQGKIIISVRYSPNVIASVPFTVNIGVADDGFFQWNDPSDGQRLAIITHADGTLVGNAPLSIATPGETLVGYGTGCAPDPAKLPDDTKPVPTFTPSAVTPTIFVGGKAAQVVAAGLAQGFAGLCQYNFVVPAGLAGDVAMQFAGNAFGYVLRLKK